MTTLSGGGDGIYYITGPVQIEDLSGTNVLLYLTGAGQLTALNNKRLTLTDSTPFPSGIVLLRYARV